jgi:mono/diheme cytochrome c family protein
LKNPAARFTTRTRLATAALAAVVALGAAAAFADEPAPADIGRKTYTSYCARCHGVNLVMVTGTFDLRLFPKDDKERFVRAVNKGLRAMPAWEGIVKPEEIDAVWAYVGSVNGWGAAEAPK